MEKVLRALTECVAQRPSKAIGTDSSFHSRIAESLVKVGRTWSEIADAGLWNGEWFQRTYLFNWWYCCGTSPEAVGAARYLMQLALDLERSAVNIRPDYLLGVLPQEAPAFDQMRQNIDAFVRSLLRNTRPDESATGWGNEDAKDWSDEPDWEELQPAQRRLLQHMRTRREDSHANIMNELGMSSPNAVDVAACRANTWLEKRKAPQRLSTVKGEERLRWEAFLKKTLRFLQETIRKLSAGSL
jgi:hypothetical protein